MEQQFVITHTMRQIEISTLLDLLVTKTIPVKI